MEVIFSMPIFLSQEEMRSIIMDHYMHPHNIEDKSNDSTYLTIHMDSASCIDDIFVHVKFVDDHIEDIKWHFNQCCAISRASSSIMSELLIGKTIEEAKEIIDNFNAMLDEREYDTDLLEEANCFCNTSKQPSRINCATISYRGFLEALKEYRDEKK